jgi:protein SOK2
MGGPGLPALPAMNAGQPMPGQGYAPPQGFDTTGQIAPPGMKPRVTATLWEDEGSLCFQVEAKSICVARREGMELHTLEFYNSTLITAQITI